MRTTLTLDPDVAQLLKAGAHRQRKAFKEVVNDAIRRGLSPRSGSRLKPPGAPQTRLLPGIDLAGFNQLADELEDDALIAKAKTASMIIPDVNLLHPRGSLDAQRRLARKWWDAAGGERAVSLGPPRRPPAAARPRPPWGPVALLLRAATVFTRVPSWRWNQSREQWPPRSRVHVGPSVWRHACRYRDGGRIVQPHGTLVLHLTSDRSPVGGAWSVRAARRRRLRVARDEGVPLEMRGRFLARCRVRVLEQVSGVQVRFSPAAPFVEEPKSWLVSPIACSVHEDRGARP